MEKRKEAIRFPLLFWGLVFLVNPIPMLMDVLPDCIGYLLLFLAIAPVSEGLGSFRDAKQCFGKLAILTLTKIPCFILVLGVASASSFREGAIITVAALAYAVGEACFWIPAIRHLFRGCYHMGERLGCTSCIIPYGKKGNKSPENLEFFTLFFAILRLGMSTLPEMMFVFTGDAASADTRTIAGYFVVTAVGSLAVLVVGILWLREMYAYLKRMTEEANASPAVLTLCVTRPETDTQKTYRLLSLVMTLLSVGIFFTMDYRIDDINILPDFLTAFCWIAVAFLLHKLTRNDKPLVVLSLLYGLSTFIAQGATDSYFATFYTVENATLVPEAEEAYLALILTQGVSAVLLFVLAFLLLRRFMGLLDGYMELGDTQDAAVKAIALRTKKEHKWRWCGMVVLAALASLAALLAPILAVDYTREETVDGFIRIPALSWFPLLGMALGLAWFLFGLYTTSRAREELAPRMTK